MSFIKYRELGHVKGISDFKRKIRTCTGIWTSYLQISSLALRHERQGVLIYDYLSSIDWRTNYIFILMFWKANYARRFDLWHYHLLTGDRTLSLFWCPVQVPIFLLKSEIVILQRPNYKFAFSYQCEKSPRKLCFRGYWMVKCME